MNRAALSIALICVGLLTSIAGASAQATYHKEFWPELDVSYRLDDRWTLGSMWSISRYRDSGAAYQTEAGVFVDHRFDGSNSARIGYRHGWSVDGGSYWENRLLLEYTYRAQLAERIALGLRTRADLRWQNTGFSVRLRERATIERETTIGHYTFTPYVSAEIYYDTRYGQFSRYRLIAGTTFPLRRYLAIEPYYAHQVDFAVGPTIVDALGFTVKLSF